MALYILEYDLRKAKDYQKLYDELNSFGAIRILESLWCFHRNNTNSEQLLNYFAQYIDSDDGIIVAEVSDWATLRTLGNPSEL